MKFQRSNIIVRVALAILVLGSILVALKVMVPRTAHAATNDTIVHHIINGPWYLHPGSPTDIPHIHSQISDLMQTNTEFDVQCFAVSDAVAPDGTLAINGNGDVVWEYGVDADTGNSGFVSDQGLDTQVTQGQEIAQLEAQGVPECGSNPATTTGSQSGNTNLQPATTVPIFISYDRNAALNWATANAMVAPTPTDVDACTWYASQVLAAGGLPQDGTWNTSFYGPEVTNGGQIRYGTDTAWVAPQLVKYLAAQPYVQVEPLGHMNAGNNDIPDARPGDIIAYVWNGKDSNGNLLPTDLTSLDHIEHLSVVVGHSGTDAEYPTVAEWGNTKATPYPDRGWTYSYKSNGWLQNEPAQHDMFAYLIHIQSEDDLIISSGN